MPGRDKKVKVEKENFSVGDEGIGVININKSNTLLDKWDGIVKPS